MILLLLFLLHLFCVVAADRVVELDGRRLDVVHRTASQDTFNGGGGDRESGGRKSRHESSLGYVRWHQDHRKSVRSGVPRWNIFLVPVFLLSIIPLNFPLLAESEAGRSASSVLTRMPWCVGVVWCGVVV